MGRYIIYPADGCTPEVFYGSAGGILSYYRRSGKPINMVLSYQHMVRALAVVPLMLFLFSCSTYNTRIGTYYTQVLNKQYEQANKSLEHNKLLNTRRNRLLYLLEKGKMCHLLNQYDSSNRYFNEADGFMESARTSAGDVALGTLLNPMMQKYKGEDFEKFMVHYYKALNYLYLNQPEEAMVEARRITLQTYAQQDKTDNKDNRYSNDAFSLTLQGIIYEQSGDINNAFIAYRNAVDLYIKNNNSYYGVPLPDQLKQDLLHMAAENGFTDEVQRYEELLNTTYQPQEAGKGGSLVLFWESGLAPVKQEQNFFFSLVKDGGGNFMFADATGAFNIPFDYSSGVNRDDLKIEDLRSFRVAFPKYEERPLRFTSATVSIDSVSYTLEATQDINTLAFATLKERFIKEMSQALSRLVVKKIAEAAARPKKDDKNKDSKEALALAIQLFNFASEKADTRNWQSLPHTIFYTRIPLQQGTNQLQLRIDGIEKPIEFTVEGTGRLQVQNICTLQ